MEELSIEEKAKAYDEALKVLHKYDGANIMFTQDLKEEMFPELKESEEERIRKWLISTLKSLNSSPVQIDDAYEMMLPAIAWLEKQGKSSSTIHYWTEEEIEPIISDYLRGAEHYGGMIGRLRCLKPKSLEKQDEQKPDDKSEVDQHSLPVSNNSSLPTFDECIYHPCTEKAYEQKFAEWSEVDDEHLERILKELESQRQRPFNRPYLDKIESDYNWLKSLRPQNRWKPSDEQMEALKGLLGLINQKSMHGRELVSLIEQLKKLREE